MSFFWKGSVIIIIVVLALAALTNADNCQGYNMPCYTVSESCCKPYTCHGFIVGACS